MDLWYRDSYLKLQYPFKIIHGRKAPSWLKFFRGSHPPEIIRLIEDLKQGRVTIEQRANDDIEKLLKSFNYRIQRIILELLYYVVSPTKSFTHKAMMLIKKILNVSKKRWYVLVQHR